MINLVIAVYRFQYCDEKPSCSPLPATSTTSSKYTFQKAGATPTITLEPANQRVLLPNNGTFNLNTTECQHLSMAS